MYGFNEACMNASNAIEELIISLKNLESKHKSILSWYVNPKVQLINKSNYSKYSIRSKIRNNLPQRIRINEKAES